MKKILVNITLMSIFFVIVLFCICGMDFINLFGANIFTKQNDTQNYNIENMQYSFDGIEWSSYNSLNKADVYTKKTTMYIKGDLPSQSMDNPALLIKTKNNFYNVFLDNKMIGRSVGNIGQRQPGILWSIIKLPDDYKGKTIKMVLQSNNINEIGSIKDIYVSDKFHLCFTIVLNSLMSTIFSVFCISIGFLIVLSILGSVYRKNGFFHLGFFCILIGFFWLTSLNALFEVVISNSCVLYYISFIALYLMPIPVLLFTKYYNKKNAKLHDLAAFFHSIFLTIIILMDLFNIVYIDYWQSVFVFIFVFEIIYCFNILFKHIYNLRKSNLKENHLEIGILTTFSLVILSIIFEFYFFLVNGNDIMRLCTLPFFMILFLCVSTAMFTINLKKINAKFLFNSSKVKINKASIKNLINAQNKVFQKSNFEEISKSFYELSPEFLFPKLFTKKTDNNITTSHMLNDYYDFTQNSSSLICMKIYDTVHYTNQTKYKILAASGKYEKYSGIDSSTHMPQILYEEILDNMRFQSSSDISKIIVNIGDAKNNNGIILYEGLASLSVIQRTLLKSYMMTIATLLENHVLVNTAKNIQYNTIYNLNEISELKSKETGNHIRRVSFYSSLLAEKLGFKDDELEIIKLASSMHDIGKINIPDSILNKPGKLTDDEYAIMNTHSKIGYDILSVAKTPVMEASAIIAYYHHEKFNGKGNLKMKGDEIPIYARIVAVADVFDALICKRVYKKAWYLEDVLNLFKQEHNNQFDGKIVDVLLSNIDEFIEIKNKFADG